MTRTHERDLEASGQTCCGGGWGAPLPMASQCGCNQVQIPLLYDTLIGMRTLLREMRDSLAYLVIVADELKELKDEQMKALRGCGCCHLHGTPECGHHDETRSAEPTPADAGSHFTGCTCLQIAYPHDDCPVHHGVRGGPSLPSKAESAAAQREGGLCTLCNDGVWKGETHFERSEKHTKASP